MSQMRFNRKILAVNIVIIVLSAFMLSACTVTTNDSVPESTSEAAATPAPTPDPTPYPTAEPMPESVADPTSAPTSAPISESDSDNDIENEVTYVLNTSTQKIHHPNCKSVDKIKPENYATTDKSLEELLEEGYSKCGNCW